MKAVYFISFILILSACDRSYYVDLHLGSPKKIKGPVVEKEIPLSGFDGIILAMDAEVSLVPSSEYYVHISAAEEIVNDLMTHIDEGTWRIDTERPYQYDWKTKYRPKTEIVVHMPSLKVARVTGSGTLTVTDYFPATNDFLMGVSGSGDLDVLVHANEVYGKIAGSGAIVIEGETQLLDIKISGSGDLKAKDLITEVCEMRVFGSGDAVVNVQKQLTAQTSGSGDIRYIGSPNIHTKKSGSGSVSRMF